MSDLVTLTIDGTEVTVPNGTLVVDAAKKLGVEIPVFCYHPKLEPVGMCRMCLVSIGRPARDRATGELILEEDGSPKINFWSGLETGCTIPVSEGMVVITNSQPVEEARETIIEFLLTSHPLDCPICDKGGECPLQNLTMAYGDGQTRMIYSDKLKMEKHVPLGDLIYLDRERCIQCARCVRFQDEIVDDPVLAFHNRGRRLEIVTMSEPGFDSYWSGNTTDICPVGALTTADFRFGARPWELNTVPTLSVHGPAGSNMTFSTRREAKTGGKHVIKRVLPRQNELVNEIWISDRDRFVYHFAEASDRVQTPLIRRNGSLEPATWDEALDLVASKLEEHKDAAAGLTGDRLSNEDLYQFQKLFRKGLKSNHIDLTNRRLGGGEVVAKVGITSGEDVAPPVLLGSGDAILVVATDLHEEEPIWWLRVKQATENGAKLIVLNLRPTRLDEYASIRLQYQPGQALSTAQQLLAAAKVETNSADSLSEDSLVVAANTLVEANNLVVFYGYEGLNYSETETLARLLGNLLLLKNGAGQDHYGRENNGLIPVWPHNNTQGAWDMGIHPALLPGYKPLAEPGMDAQGIYKAVQDGDLGALYVMGTDPIGDGLMAGRGKLDFLVVQELFLTETAAAADVVLPAQSWAERDGTFTSGERRVQRYFPAIQPAGISRPDWQILGQISERMGAGKVPVAAGQIFSELAKATAQYKGMNYRSLAQVVPQWPIVDEDDASYGGNVVANRSGIGQQWPVSEEKKGDQFEVGDQIAPEVLEKLQIARIAALFTSGTLIDRSEVLAPRIARPTLIINVENAADLGLSEGDNASILIDGREYRTAVAVVDSFAPGLALMRGVPFFSGLVEAKIDKFEIVEKELVV